MLRILLSSTLLLVASIVYCENHDTLSDSITNKVYIGNLAKHIMIDVIRNEKGSIAEYDVERGDSWEILANRFGLDAEELKDLNPEWDELHVGTTIIIATFPKGSQRAEAAIIAQNPLYDEVNNSLNSEDWKSAKKCCDKIIKSDPTITAYYLRGIAQFNNGKYKEAARDFDYVVANDRFLLFDNAATLKNQASDAWEAKKAERAEMWGNIAGQILQAGAMMANEYMQMQQQKTAYRAYSKTGMSGSSSYNGNLAAKLSQPGEIQRQLGGVLQMSIAQVEQQNQMEYQQMRQAYLQYFGRDLSYSEFMYIKSQALADMTGNNTYSNSNGTTTSNNNTGYSPKCAYCDGTGRITKYFSSATYGFADPTVKCNECGLSKSGSNNHTHVDCSHCRN